MSRGELAVLEKGRGGERYHISPDSGVPVREVVQILADKLGLSLDEVSEDVAERPGQDAAYVIDSSKLRGETDWRPIVGLDQGLGEVVDWVRKNWDEVTKCIVEYVHKA